MRLIKSYLVVFILFTATTNCKKVGTTYVPPPYVAPAETTFSNPLLSSGPDPWVVKKDNMYYYSHTVGDKLQIWSTTAMSQLSKAPVQTIWTKPATGQNSENIWAPELYYLDGKWYMYYTAGSSADLSTQRIFVLENPSADPLKGTWEDKGKIADPAADIFAIDATILEHGGNKYMLWSGFAAAGDNTQHIFIAKMANPWSLSTARVAISVPSYSWEKIGSPPAVNEAPEILKNSAGKVFVIYSASGCWTDDYALGMLTLKDGGDPLVAADWTKTATPVFTKNVSNSVFGPGHNAFFKSPDGTEDWILYHANALTGQQCSPLRSPRMQKFTWNANGTPNFGTPVKTTDKIERPSGE